MSKKSRTLRVLVVDDERLLRWAIGETLTAHGHSVVQAETAADAVRVLRHAAEPLDAVLLAYHLPDSDDLSLLARVRGMAPDSAVLLMTAYGSAEIAERALRLGASGVMDKPFDMQDLEPAISHACQPRAGG